MARKALVTGGTGALGTAVCRALLDAGYQTHATASRPNHGLSDVAGLENVRVHVGDFTIEADAERVLSEVGGPLAALVSAIGGFSAGPLAEASVRDLDRLVDLNLKTAVLTLRAAYPFLKRNPGGAAAVLVAARGAVGGAPGAALYGATKAAVANLAASAAQEWLEDGISVNVILPSVIDTVKNRQDMPQADFARWPTPEQIADVIRFLVSDGARIVSGGAIPVYGRA